MALYFIIAVSLLGLFHNSDCQTVTLEAPDDVVLGQSMTVTCRFTNGASSSNTVDNIEWSCSGASIGFPVVSPSCSVFGALPSEYSGMSITPSCGTNEYSLVFASVERTTVNKSWCCNVVLSPGPSPSVKSCDSPMLSDGLLKNRWIWILLVIFVPFVTCVVAIWLITKRPGRPIKPVISPESVSVNVGDKATFTCTSSSTTDPAQSGLTMTYTWRRNGVDMKSNGLYNVSGQTLTVTKVVKGNASDTFTCIVREENGPPSDESDSARIVIIGKPTKPVISLKPVSVNVGNTATFTCTSSSTTVQAQSGLTINYKWKRNGVDMKSKGRYMVSGKTLTVTKVVKRDASDAFTCLAREDRGPTSDESISARIVISKPTKPVISLKPVSVNVDGTATFTCTSSSTTDPAQSALTMNYTWKCNGVDMKSKGRYNVSGQTLTVTKVVKKDAFDAFTCKAREDNGLTSDESDSARIVILAKQPSGTKPRNNGKSEQSMPLLKLK